VGVLINSVLIASYPELSKDFNQKGADFIRKRTEILMGYCLITVTFIVIFLILNGETIIRLLFQRGKFASESTSVVSTLLLYYIPWMIFFPMGSILTRLIFIYEDFQMFCLISFASLLFAIVIAYGLRKALGLNGLGLASGIIQSLYAAMIYSWLYLKRNFKISLPNIARVVAPGVLIAAILWIILSIAESTVALQRYGPQQLIFPGISFILLSLCCLIYLQRVERSHRIE
jgi:putative peptidoglycan lipid II flippase